MCLSDMLASNKKRNTHMGVSFFKGYKVICQKVQMKSELSDPVA